ncbi:hypothetical protein KZX46_21400 (plasmid) [Polymorphobacter sp. PAMC 29334]|uniref:hypothetical protein n=1 Tax=Polymorphobacter sp. PAMC 29334 TaxID=2862331 RepID=UPI001C77062C|nr:hypothetical protein [Polymorphobacter sp. PAMC 29334]QYE37196.1 hypothetical protein KZX46_21400 [Polymorphobacter sp. PAMC 29334]
MAMFQRMRELTTVETAIHETLQEALADFDVVAKVPVIALGGPLDFKRIDEWIWSPLLFAIIIDRSSAAILGAIQLIDAHDEHVAQAEALRVKPLAANGHLVFVVGSATVPDVGSIRRRLGPPITRRAAELAAPGGPWA